MKVIINGKDVKLEDERGNAFSMSTDQLFEMMRILNIAVREDGTRVFDILEFTI